MNELVGGEGDGTRGGHAQQIGQHAAIKAAQSLLVPRVLEHRVQRRMCGTELRVLVAMCHLQTCAYEFVRVRSHRGDHLAGTAGEHELCERELVGGGGTAGGKVSLESLVQRELHADVCHTEQRGEQPAVQALGERSASHCTSKLGKYIP